MQHIHLIATGGAIMHNMAIALHRKGYTITGSDDAIYDPARGNLEREGLLPKVGWDEANVHTDIDAVILGMHARSDNPELLKAKQLNIPIFSFPEFVANECKDKKRIVIAGSHGKTTTTAMIMFALNKLNVEFDYLVGSSIEGFDLSVKLSDAPLVIIEGDEYLSSPIDLRSKFLWYQPHISIITGIAYDHINVFPTFDSYLDTFKKYIESHAKEGKFFWFEGDKHLVEMAENTGVTNQAYSTPKYTNHSGEISIVLDESSFPLEVVGEHNLQNLQAASLVLQELGFSANQFFSAMRDFSGAGRRMEKIVDRNGQVVYRDFAHSPSKLEATIKAVKSTYQSRKLIAIFELHTFSSLNKEFLPYYKNTMQSADKAIVFFNAAIFKHKKMEELSNVFVKEQFGDVIVLNDVNELQELVQKHFSKGENILLMSSGKFDGAAFNFD